MSAKLHMLHLPYGAVFNSASSSSCLESAFADSAANPSCLRLSAKPLCASWPRSTLSAIHGRSLEFRENCCGGFCRPASDSLLALLSLIRDGISLKSNRRVEVNVLGSFRRLFSCCICWFECPPRHIVLWLVAVLLTTFSVAQSWNWSMMTSSRFTFLVSSFSRFSFNLPVMQFACLSVMLCQRFGCLIPSHIIDETCVGIAASRAAGTNRATDLHRYLSSWLCVRTAACIDRYWLIAAILEAAHNFNAWDFT